MANGDEPRILKYGALGGAGAGDFDYFRTLLDFEEERGVIALHVEFGCGGAFVAAIGIFESRVERQSRGRLCDGVVFLADCMEDHVDGQAAGFGVSLGSEEGDGGG
jgi:hypothetical protein